METPFDKSYHKQIDPTDNGVSALKNLLELEAIRVTNKSIEEIKYRDKYPNLDSLSAALNEWNVQNMCVELSPDQLEEIPYPAIAHLTKNGGHYVVLQKVDREMITYIDPETGWVRESIETFAAKWSGVVLLIERNEQSGEDNYQSKKRAELLNNLRSLSVYLLLAFVFALVLVQMLRANGGTSAIALFCLKILGIFISVVLLQAQLNVRAQVKDAICKTGRKLNCNAVLQSPASKLIGIPLPELGLLYFAGGCLTLIHSAFIPGTSVGVLHVLTLATFPFIIFSVYYQWRIVRTWCPLCVMTMGIFLLEYMCIPTFPQHVSLGELRITAVAFLTSTVLWLLFRPFLINSLKYEKSEKLLNSFRRSKTIFKAALLDAPSMSPFPISQSLVFGAPAASTTVHMVTNPVCAPCAFAHKVLNVALTKSPDKLRIEIIFITDPDQQSVSNKVATYLIGKSLTIQNEPLAGLLSAWYDKSDKTKLDGWIEDDTGIDHNRSLEILQEHQLWCRSNRIVGTPTFFINGKRLPPEYSVHDLAYHIEQ